MVRRCFFSSYDILYITSITAFPALQGIKPGFQTHNFAYLVQKLGEWGIDPNNIAIAAQFNSVGFWMCPSREGCEEALRKIPEAEVIAYGILASGYLNVPEAAEYVKSLPELNGIAVGVSKESHARKTIEYLKKARTAPLQGTNHE